MGSMIRSWCVAIVTLVCLDALVGCATPETSGRVRSHSQIFDAPYELVWDAARAATTELTYRISSTNASRGYMVAVRDEAEAAVAQYVADVIGQLRGRWWRLETTMIVSVTALSPQQTRVTLDSRLMGRISPALPGVQRSGLTVVPLQSNGRLERQLLERLAVDVHRRLDAKDTAP